MLTPAEVHFLVGVLMMAASDKNVELEMGTPMTDGASGSPRDIDLTVRCSINGKPHILAGIEVKAHSRPLDIEHVEQLVIKLADVGLAHRAIVSASGYTAAAIKKARAHGVELLRLTKWTSELSDIKTPLRGSSRPLLSEVYWSRGPQFHVEATMPENIEGFNPSNAEVLIEEKNGDMVQRTIEVLLVNARKAAENQVEKEWGPMREPGTRVAEVNSRSNLINKVLVLVGPHLVPVKWVQVMGELAQEAVKGDESLYYLVRNDPLELVVACSVRELRDGTLCVIACNHETRRLTPHVVTMNERMKRRIYALPLERQTQQHTVNLILDGQVQLGGQTLKPEQKYEIDSINTVIPPRAIG